MSKIFQYLIVVCDNVASLTLKPISEQRSPDAMSFRDGYSLADAGDP